MVSQPIRLDAARLAASEPKKLPFAVSEVVRCTEPVGYGDEAGPAGAVIDADGEAGPMTELFDDLGELGAFAVLRDHDNAVGFLGEPFDGDLLFGQEPIAMEHHGGGLVATTDSDGCCRCSEDGGPTRLS